MEGQQGLPLLELDTGKKEVITPAIEVLSQVASAPIAHTSIKKTLDELFPEQQYDEKDIQLARETLGSIAEVFNKEQLKNITVEIRYLVETWLDSFEQDIFNGLTLRELLHEKGGR